MPQNAPNNDPTDLHGLGRWLVGIAIVIEAGEGGSLSDAQFRRIGATLQELHHSPQLARRDPDGCPCGRSIEQPRTGRPRKRCHVCRPSQTRVSA